MTVHLKLVYGLFLFSTTSTQWEPQSLLYSGMRGEIGETD